MRGGSLSKRMAAVWPLTVVIMIDEMAVDIATAVLLNRFKHRNGHLVGLSIFGIALLRVQLAVHQSWQANPDMDGTWIEMAMGEHANDIRDFPASHVHHHLLNQITINPVFWPRIFIHVH